MIQKIALASITFAFAIGAVFIFIVDTQLGKQSSSAPIGDTQAKVSLESDVTTAKSGSDDTDTHDMDDISDDYFVYELGNFAFKLADGWVAQPSVPSLPLGYSNPKFFLKKQGATCVIGYFDHDRPSFDDYAQTGFGTRTFSGTMQFDSQWYAPQLSLPEDFTFSFGSVTHAKGEIYDFGGSFNVPTYDTQANLILFDENAGLVPDGCAEDMQNMLTTWKKYFKKITLTKELEGYLFFGRVDATTTENSYHLFFKSTDVDAETYDVGVSPFVATAPVFLNGSTLEGFNQDGKLITMNLFEPHHIQSTDIGISSLVFSRFGFGSSEWYLVSNGTHAEFGNELYQRTGAAEAKKVGTVSVRYGHIEGYDPKEKRLVITGGYGDGGCSSREIQTYSAEGGFSKMYSYGQCEGDILSAEEIQRRAVLEKITKGIASRAVLYPRLELSHGILSMNNAVLPRVDSYIQFTQMTR